VLLPQALIFQDDRLVLVWCVTVVQQIFTIPHCSSLLLHVQPSAPCIELWNPICLINHHVAMCMFNQCYSESCCQKLIINSYLLCLKPHCSQAWCSQLSQQSLQNSCHINLANSVGVAVISSGYYDFATGQQSAGTRRPFSR